MEGSVKYKRAWTIEEALEQHQNLLRQHELQQTIGENHINVRRQWLEVCCVEAAEAKHALDELLGQKTDEQELLRATARVNEANQEVRMALRCLDIVELRASEKSAVMNAEIEKSNQEMIDLRRAIDDVAKDKGPPAISVNFQATGITDADSKSAVEAYEEGRRNREVFYCSNCNTGGHGQRFCSYLLKRPNWQVYPSEKWFEDKGGQTSYCPLGRKAVDFADETYFSRIAMHLKGRIWLEDKRKLYEFIPDLMPLTFVIQDCKWVGEQPPPEKPGEVMPWFVKETDRNWGTSVVCCQRPEECISLTKPGATYVVQRHIPDPLLYDGGVKAHIKFYNLIIGEPDGVTWKVYCYKDGYLSISPKPWSPTDLSKETQVTIIRSKRINDWSYWPILYPTCKAGVAEVVKRAAAQGKLEGRYKKQFEIISCDYCISADMKVWLLEFNSGPVLKDPEDSPDVHDAGMITGALHIIEPWEGGDEDKWDLAGVFQGVPPAAENKPSIF
jgi:hypothetical protein